MTGLRFNRRHLLRTSAAAGATLAAGGMLGSRPAQARDKKLVYWHIPTFTPMADEAARQFFDEFCKQAGLKESEVSFIVVPNSELVPRLSAALEAGSPPDVVRLYKSYVQLYRAQGQLLDVTDVVEKMKKAKGGLFDSSLSAIAYDGHYWGVPFAINPWPMHARVDLLEKAKLDYPKTWDEFVETCLKLQQPPFYGFGMDVGLTNDASDNIMEVCWGFGGRTTDEKGMADFDNEGNVKGFAFINEMYNVKKIIPRGSVGNGETAYNNKLYQSKQVAFIINPSSVYAYLSDKDPDLMEKTGLFGVPAGPVAQRNLVDTWSLGLFKQSPNPELSRGLAEYFMQPGPLQPGHHQQQWPLRAGLSRPLQRHLVDLAAAVQGVHRHRQDRRAGELHGPALGRLGRGAGDQHDPRGAAARAGRRRRSGHRRGRRAQEDQGGLRAPHEGLTRRPGPAAAPVPAFSSPSRAGDLTLAASSTEPRRPRRPPRSRRARRRGRAWRRSSQARRRH